MTPQGTTGSAQYDSGSRASAADPAFRPVASATRRFAEGGAGALIAAFDHLLRQNDWARTKLAIFAGRRVRIGVDAPLFGALSGACLTTRVTDDGLLEVTDPTEDPVDVHMVLRPSIDAAFALIRGGPRGLSPYLRLDGEVMLAAALGEIAEQLRWDAEEDLSRVTGDIVARRIGQGVESARAAMRELRSRVESSTGRHLAGDSGQLVGRGELTSMRSAIEQLEMRVSRLDAPAAAEATAAHASWAPANQPIPGALLQLQPPLELPHFEFDPEGPNSPSRPAEPS